MNTISILFYLVNLLVNLQVLSTIFFVVFGSGFIILTMFYAIESCEYQEHKQAKTLHWTFGTIVFISLVLITIIPSKETMMFIIASELGEEVITHPEFEKTFGLLKDNVDKYLSDNLRVVP